MKPERTSKVLISTKTWSRDSYNLFDYESIVLSEQQHLAEQDCSILRIGNEVDFLEHNQEICYQQSESRIIAKIELSPRGFSIKSGKEEDLWRVVNSASSGHELHKNEIIKLGRVKLQVTHLKTKGAEKISIDSIICAEGGVCRICFNEDNTNENPLIAPCHCTGTMKFIHLACLQTWINSKISKTTSGESVSYNWKNMDCEICQQQFPLAINCIGPYAFLAKIEDSESPYIILESMERDKNRSRGLHLIQFNSEETLKMGRGHDSDIKFNDISVSRFHASLTYSSGKFVIKDNKSKFGTLVQIPDSIDISETLTIQAGRTLISMNVVDGISNMVIE
ncbi:hypothetical protein SteCoe_15252 [Stentor coeruleus]|uniref:RING-CH-type domain-containing protein n=1 Tax=Stentor coeruleus TaxID=5963 RepID=A0A1R2C421_9CILI|nr:hypothetical protein SteCoe_15252 [Stentor coeruleus]